MYLSKSYGTAKARILNDLGEIELLNTENHPNTVQVDMVNDNVAKNLEQYVSDVAQNKK